MTEGARAPLERLFSPRSVAIVGASERNQAGMRSIRNLEALGYPGQVVAVNPGRDDVLGVPCYPRLSDIPYVPDAVMVTLGKDRVLPVIEECAALGVGGAVVPAMGFAEAGEAGARLQDRLAAVARESHLALVGPNCQGVVSFESRCALYLRDVQPYEPGRVAVVSQSGSMATAIVNSRAGLRFRHVASTGNEAVVTAGALVDHFARDPAVTAILVFAEAIREPERFLAACDLAQDSGKLVAVLKAGRTQSAQAAARSHSGAVGTPDRLVDALFRSHGVVRVDSVEELLAVGLVADGRLPEGPRVAAVTISGGQIALLHDHADRAGVTFPAPAPGTAARLQELLPDFLVPANPLDVWGMEDLEHRYGACLAALADDPGVDVAIAVAEQSQYPTGHEGAHRVYFDAARSAAKRSPKTVAVLAAAAGGFEGGLVESLRAEGVLALGGFDVALRAIGKVGRRRGRPAPGAAFPALDLSRLRHAFTVLGGVPASGPPALRFLEAAGIPVAPWREAASPQEAVRAARELGHPVAVKTADPHLLHKTEAGAVETGLGTDGDVLEAAERISGRRPGPLLVQRMAAGEVELIAGTTSAGDLGTFVLAGAGGIWVEVVDDVSVRPGRVSAAEALEMVSELRIAPLLTGARGRPACDLAALADLLSRLGEAAAILGDEVDSIDVNPVAVWSGGAVAVDAAVIPKVSAGGGHRRSA